MHSPFSEWLPEQEVATLPDVRSPFVQPETEILEHNTPQVTVIRVGDAALASAPADAAGAEEYKEPRHSGNPLFRVVDRNVNVTKHFRLGELMQAQAGTYKFKYGRLDPLLIKNLQAIREFTGRPVHIIDGYYPPGYARKTLRIKDETKLAGNPHIYGRGVKFSVEKYQHKMDRVAAAALLVCDEDCNFSIGSASMALYVKQPYTAFQHRFTSYIPDDKAKTDAFNFLIAFKTHLAPDEMFDNLVHQATIEFIQGLLGEYYLKRDNESEWMDTAKKALDLLLSKSGNAKGALYRLAYSKLGNLVRYYERDTSPRKQRTVSLLVETVGTRLYMPSKYKFSKGPDLTAYHRDLVEICVNRYRSYRTAPVANHFFDPSADRGDEGFYNIITSLLKETGVELPVAPAVPEGGTKKRLVETPARPDKPAVDLTGVYYFDFGKGGTAVGMYVLVNQAGNYISGKFAGVYDRHIEDIVINKIKPGNLFESVREFYGKLDTSGTAICNMVPLTKIILKMSSPGTLDVQLGEDAANIIQYEAVNNKPVLSGNMLKAFPPTQLDMVTALAWIRPPKTYLDVLKLNIVEREEEIDRTIRSYYDIFTDSFNRFKRDRLRTVIRKLHDQVKFYLPRMYRHLEGYYIRLLLNNAPSLKPSSDKPTMTKLAWVRKMLTDY
ncbi:MAG TPA: hypothetical protein VFZ78_12490, partial [Flavisolibacter sp.]